MFKSDIIRVSAPFKKKLKEGYFLLKTSKKDISFVEYTKYLTILLDDDIKELKRIINKKNEIDEIFEIKF